MRKWFFRYTVFFFGMVFMTLGIALSVHAGLGTTPISSPPVVLANFSGMTVGEVTVLMNWLFVVIQWLLLRKDFAPVQWLQCVATFVFGACIDLHLRWLSPIPLPDYPCRLLAMSLGIAILAFGIWLEIKPKVLVMPGEGMVIALSKRLHIPFPTMKIIFDSSLVVFSAIFALVAMGNLNGVREGTAMAMIFVGLCVKLWLRLLRRFDRYFD